MQFSHHVNCVLLNACYSKDQAKAISKHINYVIGMNKSVSDEASIAFTIGFYQALGAGRTIEEAYELGCAHIELLGISEYQTPVLIKKGQIPQQAGIPKKRKADALRLDEIFDVVKNSNPSDWNVNFNQGTEIAVFKSAPALRIETRSNSEFIHNNDFYENWVNKFSDSHAVSYYYHLYYGSSRLKEFILVSVDGGRALLPLPNSQLDLGVDPLRYKIAMIFDESNTCQDYMKRAGLYVVD